MLNVDELIKNVESSKGMSQEEEVFLYVANAESISTNDLIKKGISAELLLKIANVECSDFMTLYYKGEEIFSSLMKDVVNYQPELKKRRLF